MIVIYPHLVEYKNIFTFQLNNFVCDNAIYFIDNSENTFHHIINKYL